MKEKELILPDDWEVKEVVGNKIFIREKEVELPKRFGDCFSAKETEYLSNWPIEISVPVGMVSPVRALCRLLICRNAWWKQLGWKPDWEDSKNKKYAISITGNNSYCYDTYAFNAILVFPTYEVRDQFLDSFRDLIEEAKELL